MTGHGDTMIPQFREDGLLPPGIHLCSGSSFIDYFCFNEYRNCLSKSIADIFDWAVVKYATRVFVGGSFVSNRPEPHDIDCLIVFYNEESIPHKSEMLTIVSTRIDIQFCSEQHPELIDSFLYLFMHSRIMDEVGVIEIDLHSRGSKWEIRHYPDDDTYEIVKRAYINRFYVDHYDPNGILVTIHGMLSSAKWNMEIAPIASGQNWIFAPYVYDTNSADLLINAKKRKHVVDQFREWLYDIHRRYEPAPVSVIAHSFGTYIIASYVSGFEEFSPVQLNCIILTGSIVTSKFDWESHRGPKVARVLNEIAPNDQWVKHMPKLQWLDADPLFGNSGVQGFDKKSEIVTERASEIFDHNNVIKRDVIERYWLPFLMANRDASRIEGMEYVVRKARRKQI